MSKAKLEQAKLDRKALNKLKRKAQKLNIPGATDMNLDQLTEVLAEAPAKKAPAEDYLTKFKEDPKSLTKKKHVAFAKTLNLKLAMSLSEDEMIEKINDALKVPAE